ncbi:MAG: hypothetical protein WAU82_10585 [Candidatus Binatus sp.]
MSTSHGSAAWIKLLDRGRQSDFAADKTNKVRSDRIPIIHPAKEVGIEK